MSKMTDSPMFSDSIFTLIRSTVTKMWTYFQSSTYRLPSLPKWPIYIGILYVS
jgi:hypothetical protein